MFVINTFNSEARRMNSHQPVLYSTALPAIAFLLLNSPFIDDVFYNEAKELAKDTFIISEPVDIDVLDPPPDGNKYATGLVFEEYSCIGGAKYFDDGTWAFITLPRGNVNRQPIDIWNRNIEPSGIVPYVYSNYSYTSSCITPSLPVPIPLEGQYVAGLNVIHKVDGIFSWPQILVLNGDGYLRLSAEPPKTFGTSYRLATHNVGSITPAEDFPRIVKVATKMKDEDKGDFSFLIDSEAFTGAIKSSLTPGIDSSMDVRAAFFMRRDLIYSTEPNSGFVGLSSLFWKGEADTPSNDADEAHDADTLIIGYSDSSTTEYPLYSHFSGDPIVVTFSPPTEKKITFFALEQRDRAQSHYSEYASAGYETRVSLSIENIESSIPFRITLHIFPTTSEYHDNIVAHLTIIENLTKGQEINISYRSRVY